MRTAAHKSLFPLTLALLAACGSAHDASDLPHEASTSDGAAPAPTLATLAQEAVDPDQATSTPAIDALRAAGPAGLAALLEAHADQVTQLRTVPLTADRDQLDALREDPSLARLRAAIDRVAGQRDAFASGLYWYTDLAQAQIEASRSGRPILSLRLLGNLDEEASCANSRFFRWLLYPSPIVRPVLASYVLHWSSERPAPHVTIDMGDGRTIERTITGNSIHYVLDASGRVIDAIAGLHTPEDFAERLRAIRPVADACGVRIADRACLARHHQQQLDATRTEWSILATDGSGLPSWDGLLALDAPVVEAPSVVLAEPLTIGKASIEMPMLRLMGAAPVTPPPSPVPWGDVARASRISAAYDDVLSEASRSLARLKTGDVDDGALLAVTYDRTVRDTLQNRFTLDRRIHAWLADASTPNEFASLNTRVYAELFLTPASDPWLGLRSDTDWDVLEVTGSTGTRN